MKKIFKFFDLFLNKVVDGFFSGCIFLLLFVFGIFTIKLLWDSDLVGRIILIIAGVLLIGSSAIEAFLVLKKEKLDKKLSTAIDQCKELCSDLKTLQNKNKLKNLRWRFYEYLKSNKENDNG
jgi:hypothetical protein